MTLTHIASTALDLEARAVSPIRELGAYEALWARRDTSFKTLAAIFRQYHDSVPSDFVEPRVCEKFARMVLGAISEAAIKHFGGRGRHSGSMTQAQFCIEQGRRLIAVVPAERSNRLGLYANGPTELVESGRAAPIKTSADYPNVMRELMLSKTRLMNAGATQFEFDEALRTA